MLTMPRVFNWQPTGPRSQRPFVEGETYRARLDIRRYLIAGDRHRIPFPRRILDADGYYNAESCRVRLFVQTDGRPYPGIDYVMEIHLPGNRGILGRAARIALSPLNTLRTVSGGASALTGPLAAGVTVGANILLDPSPVGSERHWTERAVLNNGPAVIRYDFLD